MLGHILIVDDNPIDLKLASAALEVGEFNVDVAADAEQAQDMLPSMLPDLILIDIALPGIDGLSLTRIVKADPRLRHVPVVALTAFAMQGDDERAAAAGCVGYITKPINPRRFAGQILDILNAARSGAQKASAPAGE